jgi:ATP-dependent Lon protease
VLLTLSALAASDDSTTVKTNPTPAQVEAKYTAAIEGRTADILKVLALSDTNQAAKVHDVIIAQYRALNAWHDANDAKLKAARKDPDATAQIHASLKTLHDEFLSKLAENLTPDQIEQVKDKMTYGKVQFTYAGYCSQYSNLSETNKQEILKMLKEAREEAMDGGSAKEKTAIFLRYKGKINNYLSKQGIHPDAAKLPAQ